MKYSNTSLLLLHAVCARSLHIVMQEDHTASKVSIIVLLVYSVQPSDRGYGTFNNFHGFQLRCSSYNCD